MSVNLHGASTIVKHTGYPGDSTFLKQAHTYIAYRHLRVRYDGSRYRTRHEIAL